MSWLRDRRTPLLVLLTALLVVLAAIWGFYTSDGSTKARERDARLEQANAEGPRSPGPTLEVRVQIAADSEAAEIVELSGVLEPVRATWVAAEIAGRITQVPIEEHTAVSQGDLLVALDPALPRAELIRAEANHARAKSELKRQERLGSQSVASQAELERAKSEERARFASLLEAKTRLNHTRITAPFDGLVNSLDLDPGAYVQPGTRIAEVLDLSVIEVRVLVSDRQINALSPGMSTNVRVDSLGREPFVGKIVRVGGAPASGGQRYPVVVALDAVRETSVPREAPESTGDADRGGPIRRLRPGMIAHVRFEIGGERAMRLPTRAVVGEFELDYAFVLDAENTARRVRVETRPVPFRPDLIEIVSGLEAGDRVAVTAINQLRDGLRVLVR